jgi:peptidyl-prolyl cis-trans isomerase B (cyclophilin B)
VPKRLLAVLALLLAAALAACGDDDSGTATDDGGSGGVASGITCTYVEDGSESAKQVDPPPATPSVTGQVNATMATSVGDFQLTLDADTTPCTVNSFVSLAQQGYFDGTSCHRLTTAGIFVLQCGDPTGTGTGGPGYTIPDELSGSETYPAGTLAMAKTSAPNSGGSQFFIVYEETELPPSYTVFGTVDDATVAAIQKVAAAGTDNSNGQGDGAPITPVDITSVTVD